MLMTLWILVVISAAVSSELFGNHVCEVEDSYPVNVTQYFLRNVTLRNYKWCMGFPPRCSFYTFRTINVPEIVEKLETRKVKKCCEGFIENEERSECVPCQKCFEGTCGIGGKCYCNSGFHGIDCAEACIPMRWGIDCQHDCLCKRGSCNPRTGRCECPSGWFGTRCELLCLEGFYGKHCINRCRCGERDLCNPETGECIMKRNPNQEHQSTRAIHFTNSEGFDNNFNRFKSTPSLKIYHTFDLDLSTPETPIRVGNDKLHFNSTKMMGTTPVFNGTIARSYNKKIHSNKKTTLPKRDDSFESTTEMVEELFLNREHIPIINDYGSLEKKDSVDGNSGKTFEKNPKMINEILMHFTHKPNSTQKKYSHSPILVENTSSSLLNRKFDITSSEKHLKPSTETTKRSWTKKYSSNTKGTTNKIRMNLSKENKSSPSNFEHNVTVTKSNTIETTSNTKRNGGDEVEEVKNKEFSEKKSRIETAFTKNSVFKTVNKSSSSKKITIVMTDDDFYDKSKLKKNSIGTSTNRNASIKTNYPISTIAMNNQDSEEKKKNEKSNITKHSTLSGIKTVNDPPASIRSFSTSTPMMSTPKDGHKLSIVEDDKLQILDTMNILTSTEISTLSHEWTTIFSKDAVIPSTQDVTVTRSYIENLGNDLPFSQSSGIEKPLKEAFDFSQRKEDDFSKDEASGEYEYSTDKNIFSAHMTVAAFISFFLVLIISILILIHHYIRRKNRDVKTKTDQHQIYSGGPSVSVYTHSIFHTPLPDPPPTFENPIFITPSDTSIDHRTFQTHVVCSLNFPGHRIDEKEYTYDHPPSTGSYRAASIPEPPELNGPISVEPLYDEIPSNRKDNFTSPPPSYKSSCLYVNTCGKTKL